MVASRPLVAFVHPSDEMYGADRQLIALVELSIRHCRVMVVLPDDATWNGRLSTALRERGAQVVVGPLPVLRRSYRRPRVLLAWILRAVRGSFWLLRTLRSYRPRVIVTNTSAPVAGPIVAWLLRVQHIWYIRELVESPRWFSSYIRGFAALPRGVVVTNSRAVARWVGRVRGREVVPIHNAVPPSRGYEPMRETPTAVFVGRLNAWKGWDAFADAASIVHASLPESRFILAGGTVPGSVLDDQVVRDRLGSVDPGGSWLTWLGELDDGREAMKQGWVVVVPSQKPEPFGNVAIEGMAEGRPVVGTRMGGITEIVDDGVHGYLVEPDSTQELARAILQLLSDKDLAERMGAAARARYEEAFTPEVRDKAWLYELDLAIRHSGR